MRITYYALRPLLVGDENREPGDLVPEAKDWAFLSAYLDRHEIAPVLVASLPEETQVMLLDWEEEQAAEAEAVAGLVAEVEEEVSDPEEQGNPEDDESEEEADEDAAEEAKV